jgi:sulfate-transporting ATPase
MATTIELLGLGESLDCTAGDLSQGQRKLVGLARALMTSPKVLLADEPAAGLDTNESSALAAYFRRLAAEGLGILLVEHDMALILNNCDYVYVLDQGRLISEGSPSEVHNDQKVRDAYLGAGPAAPQQDAP